ncbi:MAG: hypothetical protein JWP04_3941 [Belnapia sp.]|nr:hypothetical protein [Belnapia sp.]
MFTMFSRKPAPPELSHAYRVVEYLTGLQRDGRLLLRYLARKADRPLGAQTTGAVMPDVLTVEPALLNGRFGELASFVDDLSRRAAPATVTSIRLTSAYLRVPVEGDEPPEDVRKKVRRLHRTMWLVIIIAIVATLLAVVLLAHVDDGRRAIQQLGMARADLATVRTELEKLAPTTHWVVHAPVGAEASGSAPAGLLPANPLPAGEAAPPRPFLPFCAPHFEGYQGNDPVERDAMNARLKREREAKSWSEPATVRAATLCASLDEGLLREDLVFIRLAAWNCRTALVLPSGWGQGWPQNACRAAPVVTWPSTVVPAWWERTELRASAAMSVFSGFVLPLLLGCVGGCAYALRRLDQKLSEWTLETRDGQHSLLRVLLATMLGGLLGLVWSGDEPVQLGAYTLSLAAAAFFVGFSLEVVFTVIEAMVDGVAGKLRAPPPAPQVISVQTTPPAPLPDTPRGPDSPQVAPIASAKLA